MLETTRKPRRHAITTFRYGVSHRETPLFLAGFSCVWGRLAAGRSRMASSLVTGEIGPCCWLSHPPVGSLGFSPGQRVSDLKMIACDFGRILRVFLGFFLCGVHTSEPDPAFSQLDLTRGPRRSAREGRAMYLTMARPGKELEQRVLPLPLNSLNSHSVL